MPIKRKQKIIIWLMILIIICLLASSLYWYFEFYNIKKEKDPLFMLPPLLYDEAGLWIA